MNAHVMVIVLSVIKCQNLKNNPRGSDKNVNAPDCTINFII